MPCTGGQKIVRWHWERLLQPYKTRTEILFDFGLLFSYWEIFFLLFLQIRGCFASGNTELFEIGSPFAFLFSSSHTLHVFITWLWQFSCFHLSFLASFTKFVLSNTELSEFSPFTIYLFIYLFLYILLCLLSAQQSMDVKSLQEQYTWIGNCWCLHNPTIWWILLCGNLLFHKWDLMNIMKAEVAFVP